ncbi:hypothetical protein [Butyrivibrio sp. INlla16]|uniref:hypothetical protein n=1 Tax=Butyrivibrio sp. INlla16 TaxID=1520807 RepID=UPI00088C2665|nr:hypothetical protein [Butyrivibrio sp. INlla16]SDB68095.1 hypothetical protein SAMN02910263_04092 [Butyrivibrio sp. INlla16]
MIVSMEVHGDELPFDDPEADQPTGFIRVQRSGRSDPTCMEATGNVTLIQDIREGSMIGR